MQGKKTDWTDEMLATLRDEFPTTMNRDLVKKLGVSLSVLHRKVAELKLRKTDTFFEDNSKRIRELIKKGHQASPKIDNWKKHWFKPGDNIATRYKPGHSNREELGEERDKARIKKVQETLAALRRIEKARATFGLPRKTKLKVEKQSKRKIGQNYYLRKRGYTLDIPKGIAFYNETTERAIRIESKHQYFKFIEQQPNIDNEIYEESN